MHIRTAKKMIVKKPRHKLKIKNGLLDYTKKNNIICIPIMYNKQTNRFYVDQTLENFLVRIFPRFLHEINFCLDTFGNEVHLSHCFDLVKHEAHIALFPIESNYNLVLNNLESLAILHRKWGTDLLIFPKFETEELTWNDLEQDLEEIGLAYKFVEV